MGDTNMQNDYKLTLDIVKDLWAKTYNTDGKPDWSHILPYYDDTIFFKDTIQEIRGIDEFKKMTERLTVRSKDLNMALVKTVQQGNDIFLEWEMTISYKNIPALSYSGFQD